MCTCFYGMGRSDSRLFYKIITIEESNSLLSCSVVGTRVQCSIQVTGEECRGWDSIGTSEIDTQFQLFNSEGPLPSSLDQRCPCVSLTTEVPSTGTTRVNIDPDASFDFELVFGVDVAAIPSINVLNRYHLTLLLILVSSSNFLFSVWLSLSTRPWIHEQCIDIVLDLFKMKG